MDQTRKKQTSGKRNSAHSCPERQSLFRAIKLLNNLSHLYDMKHQIYIFKEVVTAQKKWELWSEVTLWGCGEQGATAPSAHSLTLSSNQHPQTESQQSASSGVGKFSPAPTQEFFLLI